ncbi:hypothetical protein [Moraxella sp. ZY210820]|uniref:hypothetical protein n=1 Tax=unclassified Moraxella TaxID=2685852 RepID=UPI002730A06A|nr:hypothetical protein [Moraxella sp. ZY210820]WLF83536.1 hypothetical protein LU301_09755 [Moraxella sp. ZY210820]
MKKTLLLFTIMSLLSGCYFMAMANIGGDGAEKRLFIFVDKPTVIKNVLLPVNTEVLYHENSHKKLEQEIEEFRLMPDPSTGAYEPQSYIQWGGAYVENMGFNGQFLRVKPTGFVKMPQHNEFLRLWKDCDGELLITLKDGNDWSFNPQNMYIENCGRFTYPDDGRAEQVEFMQKINQALQK